LYWTVAGLFLILLGLAFWVLRRVWTRHVVGREDPVQAEGLADRGQIRRAAGSGTLLARAATLRPALQKPGPADVGLRLGRSRGVDCWASVEDSILLLGPPRSGKGQSLVIPTILDAPEAVLTTSTRPDNLAVTFSARARRGRVVVFDPQGLAHAPGFLPTLRWSPIRGCERPQVAMARAETLVADASRSGVENASFWRTQAVSAVRCLLHAAPLADRSAVDLYRWSHAAPAAKEAIAILAQHRFRRMRLGPGPLDAIVGADERMRDSTWAMVANT
jgi:hypothetical protein